MSAQRSPITTHVLDISRGKAAASVKVALEQRISDTEWKLIKRSATNSDGRVEDLLPIGAQVDAGVYRLGFETAEYFRAQGATPTFYPSVSILFEIKNPKEHHHVPLLLSPFGYSTYRGT
jgi:5-hydroxyisourate hydrolase